MTLAAGTTLGPYEILAPLGVGRSASGQFDWDVMPDGQCFLTNANSQQRPGAASRRSP